MNRHFLPAAGLLAASFLAGCSSAPKAIVSVTNPLPSERSGEMVEIPLSQLAQVRPGTGETYVVTEPTTACWCFPYPSTATRQPTIG